MEEIFREERPVGSWRYKTWRHAGDFIKESQVSASVIAYYDSGLHILVVDSSASVTNLLADAIWLPAAVRRMETITDRSTAIRMIVSHADAWYEEIKSAIPEPCPEQGEESASPREE